MSEWRRIAISKVAIHKGIAGGPFGSSLGSKDYVPSGVPVIRGSNLGSKGKFDGTDFVFVTPEKTNGQLSRNLAIPGDVVFTQRGTLGQVGIVPSGRYETYVISQSQMRLRVNQTLTSPEFIYYQFRSPEMIAEIRNRAITTGVPHINLGILSSLEITLPPIGVQQGIVAVLGALDDKIAVNERIAATALELADLHFSVVHQSATASTTLGQVVKSGGLSLGDGYRTKRAEHGRRGVPILRVAEVGDNEIHPTREDRVREEFRPAMGGKVSRPGDIVLTTKGTVGRCAMIPPGSLEFVYSPQLCYFRTGSNSILPRNFLFHWFRGREFWRQAEVLKGQTDMADYLSLNDIRSLEISVPDEISVIEFEEKVGLLRSRMEAAASENTALAALRDTLLPQLMSGRLRVKDAEKIVEDHA
ncbi:restriction endonuclease subunit S [Streptomyces mirabilis]|uniref:restriction endonuclease subunit S n=1 Tax=Streptomyces mirabilis TaxID=68239 RepID=UPI0036994A51